MASTSDVAFLLLVFFIVMPMKNEEIGIAMVLPAKSKQQTTVKVKQSNVSLRFPATGRTAAVSGYKTMLARLKKQAMRWTDEWIFGPDAAIADAGDSPPRPMPAFGGGSDSGSARTGERR